MGLGKLFSLLLMFIVMSQLVMSSPIITGYSIGDNQLIDYDIKGIAETDRVNTFIIHNLDYELSIEYMSPVGVKLSIDDVLTDTLIEGQSAIITTYGLDYEVFFAFLSEEGVARLSINGEFSNMLNIGDTTSLSDGTEIRYVSQLPVESQISFNGFLIDALNEGETITTTLNDYDFEITFVDFSDGYLNYLVNGQKISLYYEGGTTTLSTGSIDYEINSVYVLRKQAEFIIAGEPTGILKEGETKTIPSKSTDYEISFESASNSGEITVKVNGELISGMTEGQSVILSNGSELSFVSVSTNVKVKFNVNGEITDVLEVGDSYIFSEGSKLQLSGFSGNQIKYVFKAPPKVNEVIESAKGEDLEDISQTDEVISQEVESDDIIQEEIDTPKITEKVTIIEQVIQEQKCSGCEQDDTCIPFGIRVPGEYCSLDGTFKGFQSDNSACNNNYECASNQCLNSVCTSLEEEVRESASILQKIFGWLGRLFG